MQLIISGKQFEMTEAIKDYVESKIGKITKYIENITETHITISSENSKTEGKLFKVVAVSNVPNKIIKVETEAEDCYAAIDEVADKLERQIRKHKEKMKDRNI